MDDFKPLSPAVMMAITAAPLPNFHKLWREYASSKFRRDLLADWAGDNPEKQRVVDDLIRDTTPKSDA